jgi:lipid A oxidase
MAACSVPALAETQISIFGGANWNFDADTKIKSQNLAVPGSETRSLGWDGDSFEMPPYWGLRGTYWLNKGPGWGIALDYAHTKAVADLNFKTDPDFTHLEFTDGNNLLMVDLLYRFSPVMNGTLVPYVGAGAGVTIPHVEVTFAHDNVGDPRTFEYQCCGPAAQILAGLEYKLNDSWSLFTEARLSYSHIDADLADGGSLKTDLWSPQIAVGLSYRFSSF